MKKILLFLIITGALITLFNIESKAYTTYQGIGLDTQIQELDNYTLRQIFEISNNFDGNMYYTSGSNFDYSRNILSFESITNTYKNNIYTYNLSINANYYFGVIRREGSVQIHLGTFQNAQTFLSLNEGNLEYGFLSHKFDSNSYTWLRINFFNTFASIGYFEYIYPVLIDLDYLNIDTLDISLIDYYYNLYIALKNNINLDLYYDEGYDDGYNQGEIFGYNDGYNDGLVEGYFDGQVDYYNGTYLPQLPGETSRPYNDGQVDGYQFGYNTGFDDGILSDVDTSWLINFVSGTVNVLGVMIVPGISLGVFVFIPLFLGFIGFIFRLGGRRG